MQPDMNGKQRVIIDNVKPQVDCGKFPAKRVLGDVVKVEADIFCDGHDLLRAEILYKSPGTKDFKIAGMDQKINDRWQGSFNVSETGSYKFTIRAWVDHLKSWQRDLLRRIEAETVNDIDLQIGAEFIANMQSAYTDIPAADNRKLIDLHKLFTSSGKTEIKVEPVVLKELDALITKYPVRHDVSTYPRELLIDVERVKANFSSWYEAFPRSLGPDSKTHGTFVDCISFLPYIAEMGFDIWYLPPIHPIGLTKRKGKNNNVIAEDGEPGSPWAIGAETGGHKSILPELGSLDDFKKLMEKAKEYDIEIALDIAFQCSPDHPYIKGHPDWYRQRPDGTLQFAENPPKKYEDIYPINFETEDWENLWQELKSIFLYWIEAGVKIFRVDNPHTKSLAFWGWVISEIKKTNPETIFLAEAFTRPKVMYNLAKQGFTQSYTYFSWRNTKYELINYCEELVKTEVRDFFRPNFWPNTPDILPEYLQVTNRAGFIQRLALAATLSSNYGIYGPAFELMENKAIAPGKEEYLDSEKYELKHWDIDDKNSLRKIIARINLIRKENKALQNTHSLKFHEIDNEALICYSKASDDLSNIILVVVNLDPHYTHSGWLRFPLGEFELDPNSPFQVHDLLSGAYFLWYGERNYVEINPGIMPMHIFRIRRKVRSERDFDYFM